MIGRSILETIKKLTKKRKQKIKQKIIDLLCDSGDTRTNIFACNLVHSVDDGLLDDSSFIKFKDALYAGFDAYEATQAKMTQEQLFINTFKRLSGKQRLYLINLPLLTFMRTAVHIARLMRKDGFFSLM